MNTSNIIIVGNQNTSTLRLIQNEILKTKICKLPNIHKILNLGAMPEDKDKEGSLYKDYFPKKQYYTLDSNRSADIDFHYCVDLHSVSQIHESFDLILAMSVLEHVMDPFTVSKNITSLINPGGFLFVVVPFFYPLHKDPGNKFSDYWRFSDDGIRIMFKELHEQWIISAPSVIRSVEDRASYWDKEENITTGYCALFKKGV